MKFASLVECRLLGRTPNQNTNTVYIIVMPLYGISKLIHTYPESNSIIITLKVCGHWHIAGYMRFPKLIKYIRTKAIVMEYCLLIIQYMLIKTSVNKRLHFYKFYVYICLFSITLATLS